jgi:methyltransferase
MLPLLLLVLAFVPMAFEARRSAANARALLQRGAREPVDDVYAGMQVAYPASFLAMAAEAWLRQRTFGPMFAAGAVVFVAAKGLKYWAIGSLGARWTFRVLVPPDSILVTSGPYRHMRHPNYVGVMGEILGMALLAQAPVTGATALLVFGALIRARIRVEEEALRTTDQAARASKHPGSRVL